MSWTRKTANTVQKWRAFLLTLRKRGIKNPNRRGKRNWRERFGRLVPCAEIHRSLHYKRNREAKRFHGNPAQEPRTVLHLRKRQKGTSSKLFELGVSEWAVIHLPRADSVEVDKDGRLRRVRSVCILPSGFIKGKVGAGDAFSAGVLKLAHRDFLS